MLWWKWASIGLAPCLKHPYLNSFGFGQGAVHNGLRLWGKFGDYLNIYNLLWLLTIKIYELTCCGAILIPSKAPLGGTEEDRSNIFLYSRWQQKDCHSSHLVVNRKDRTSFFFFSTELDDECLNPFGWILVIWSSHHFHLVIVWSVWFNCIIKMIILDGIKKDSLVMSCSGTPRCSC